VLWAQAAEARESRVVPDDPQDARHEAADRGINEEVMGSAEADPGDYGKKLETYERLDDEPAPVYQRPRGTSTIFVSLVAWILKKAAAHLEHTPRH